jgi:hypothetical protein
MIVSSDAALGNPPCDTAVACMTIDPTPTAARGRPGLIALLLAAAAAAILLRVVSIAEPLGIDQSLWASAVRGMSRGQLLYQDVWEQRPPGIYFVYLWGFQLFGWTPAAVAWLDILAAAATTILVWLIGRRAADPVCGAAAAALYALFTMPAWLYGYGGFLERSVSETFIIVCVAAAAWSVVSARRDDTRRWLFAAGLAAGTAVVFKPNAGLYLPALLLWLAVYRGPGSGAGYAFFARAGIMAAAGALVVPLLTLAWLWRLDLLAEAKVAVVDFNRFYVGQGFSPAQYALDFSRAVFLRMKTEPLWLAGTAGAAVAMLDLLRRRRLPPLAGLAIVWGAAAALVIVVNGARLFNSYFMQALPPLALLGAWVLTESAGRSRLRRALAVAVLAGLCVIVARRDYVGRVWTWASADLAMLRGTIERPAYLERFGSYGNNRGYSARANAELADYVRARTEPEDRIFLLGISGAGVYFAADRLTAHRFLRVNFFVEMDFPDERFRLEAVAADLRRDPPRYLIFERLHSSADARMGRSVDALLTNPVVVDLLSAYEFETRIEDFALYRRLDP